MRDEQVLGAVTGLSMLSPISDSGEPLFPQGLYRSCELWLLIDRIRYTWEFFTANVSTCALNIGTSIQIQH